MVVKGMKRQKKMPGLVASAFVPHLCGPVLLDGTVSRVECIGSM